VQGSKLMVNGSLTISACPARISAAHRSIPPAR
jgi:hypothetical protein